MSRFFGPSLVASIILLVVGCASKPKPVSTFIRTYDVSQIFDTAATQAGATKEGFSLTSTTDNMTGKAHWPVKVSYCARPDQIDEVMRVMHAEFVKQLRENGAEPGGEALPVAPAPVKGWKITYTAGTQAGTITVSRNDGADGQCREKDRREYKVDFLLEEAPKAAP